MREGKVDKAGDELTVYLPDTRGVNISRWGRGNLKLGPDVFTFSRLPGRLAGTCPGATKECQDFCYAMRVRGSTPAVWDMWERNSVVERVPLELPPGAKFVRLHVSGDFTTPEYIAAWCRRVSQYPDVFFWTYTRSWRVLDLLPALEILRAFPNMQLFASVDDDTGPAPKGWREAFISDDPRLMPTTDSNLMTVTRAGFSDVVYVCPEETGRKPNCQACGYCIKGRKGDVVFLKH